MLHKFIKSCVNFFEELGHFILLGISLFSFRNWMTFSRKNFFNQLYFLGIHSVGVTLITAFFVGMVFTLQVSKEFIRFGALKMIGGIVGLAFWRELGPILTGIVLCGRVGALIASEISTMKVNEQLDALVVLKKNLISYLVMPRVLACMLMLPLLVGLADLIGFLSGFLISMIYTGINPYAYFYSAQTMLMPFDILGGLIKAVVFGFVIGLVSCDQGLRTTNGAKGVGQSTMKAVVVSMILVFILNYFMSLILF